MITAGIFALAGIWALVRSFTQNQSDLFFAGITALGLAVEELVRGGYLNW